MASALTDKTLFATNSGRSTLNPVVVVTGYCNVLPNCSSSCCNIATILSSSVLRVCIGKLPDTGKSDNLSIARSLTIVILSLSVAPGLPKVIDPPPVTPAPVTLYCDADDGELL